MSKTSLRKELLQLEKPQLIEIILNAYSASKDTKEYFEFYLNPDIKALEEKYRALIIKEFKRTKYGHRSKARISFIRNCIKKFESFDPGPEYVMELYLFVIGQALLYERVVYFNPTLFKGFAQMVNSALKYADSEHSFSSFIEQLNQTISKSEGSRYFTNLLTETIQTFIS